MSALRLSDRNIVREYELAKRRINNYNIACLFSRTTKGSVAGAKSNYSTKELKWFEKFISRNKFMLSLKQKYCFIIDEYEKNKYDEKEQLWE